MPLSFNTFVLLLQRPVWSLIKVILSLTGLYLQMQHHLWENSGSEYETNFRKKSGKSSKGLTEVSCENCDLQEKNLKCHRKSRGVRQHALGAGSVSPAVLDCLLLLCLERSKVHGEGNTRIFFTLHITFKPLWNS